MIFYYYARLTEITYFLTKLKVEIVCLTMYSFLFSFLSHCRTEKRKVLLHGELVWLIRVGLVLANHRYPWCRIESQQLDDLVELGQVYRVPPHVGPHFLVLDVRDAPFAEAVVCAYPRKAWRKADIPIRVHKDEFYRSSIRFPSVCQGIDGMCASLRWGLLFLLLAVDMCVALLGVAVVCLWFTFCHPSFENKAERSD